MEEGEHSTSINSKRSRRNSSSVWADFTRLPANIDGKTRAECNRCGNIYAWDNKSGTSSLKRHLSSCPGNEIVGAIPHPQRLNQAAYREKLALIIIKHGYPFTFVENDAVRDMHSFLNSDVINITRNTAKSDVIKIHKREKEKLKHSLQKVRGRICLTSDMWTSIATDGYMCLTAHYADENWVLQKRILNFHHIPPPHTGHILAEKLIHFLKEWGIYQKIFTITLDNAANNKVMVNILKNHLSLSNSLFNDEWFRIRCGAHILNLIVNDGVKVIEESIHKIRESVKYVRGSEARKMKFAECIRAFNIQCGKKVCQDVSTRWNSTYLMIASALEYQLAFYQLEIVDTSFKSCPTPSEWLQIERIARFLKPFYEISTLFSGSKYPTSNLYFHGVCQIEQLILKEITSNDISMRSMAEKMKQKFDKYWKCYSLILSFSVILDPRYKMQYVSFCFKKLNPTTYTAKVKDIIEKLDELYQKYVTISTSSSSASIGRDGTWEQDGSAQEEMDEFEIFESQHYCVPKDKSQLELYLDEARLDHRQNPNFDVLDFWRVNNVRYPELSLMARDLLSIPITTVASESAFSIGGRIINKHRSSILPEIAEGLVCTRDWLYGVEAEVIDDTLHVDFNTAMELGTE